MHASQRRRSLAVVGVNHPTAQVDVRERFAFGAEDATDMMRTVIARGSAREVGLAAAEFEERLDERSAVPVIRALRASAEACSIDRNPETSTGRRFLRR